MSAPKESCPVGFTLTLFAGKWKLLTLHHLQQGSRRYTELERLLPAISPRMLVKVLRDLEQHNLVRREVHSAVPPKVEYSLTELGRTVVPLIDAMRNWGTQYRDKFDAAAVLAES